MAEVLGVVASGIAVTQVAGQITSNIIKLKGYWSQIREAPAEIDHLLQQIDSLNLMLGHMQDDRSQQPLPQLSAHHVCVQRSLDLCKDCARELSGLVNDLATKVRGKNGWRKKVGSAKVVLSKDEIKTLKRRLKTSMEMLSLAYQFHTSAMIQLQPDIIVMRVVEHFNTSKALGAPTSDDPTQEDVRYSGPEEQVGRQYDIWTSSPLWMRFLFGHYHYAYRQRRDRGKWREAFHASYKLPEVLSRYQVECWAIKSLSGWWINLDFHRILPSYDPFFYSVVNGDIPAVQSMLIARKAFITDRMAGHLSEYAGYTSLHLAASNGNAEMCRFLVEQGANPLAFDAYFETPLHVAIAYHGWSRSGNGGNSLETCRVLVDAGAGDVLIDTPETLSAFCGPLSALKYLQRQLYPPVSSMSPSSRLESATAFTRKMLFLHNSALLVEEMLNRNGAIDFEVLDLAGQDGQDIFHNIAEYWACTSYSSVECNGRRRGTIYVTSQETLDETLDSQILAKLRETHPSKWSLLGADHLIRAILATKFSVQLCNSKGKTLLPHIVSSFSQLWSGTLHLSARTYLERLTSMVAEFLKILSECGKDLQEYGCWEKAHWESWNQQVCSYDDNDDFKSFEIRLIGFDYGPRPEDWKFWISKPSDPYAGDFWKMIEEGQPLSGEVEDYGDGGLSMPGAWSEDY